jgi:hypothetical protein
MALPEDNCNLWNKLGSAAEVGASEIGVNGTIAGAVTYTPMKFDDGSLIDAVGERIRFDAINIDDKGSLEFWWQPDGYAIVNGVNDDGASHYIVEWSKSIVAQDTSIRIGTNGLGMYWYWQVGAGSSTWYFSSADFDVADGELAHLLFVWDTAGIDGGVDIRRVYLNGTLVESSVAAVPSITGLGVQYLAIGNATWALTVPGDCGFDNIKNYDDANAALTAAIIANMNNEAWPAEPAIEEIVFTKKQPRVLVLNSEIDLYDLGYVLKDAKVIEQKTFERDKVITNQTIIPVHNIDDQFNPDNPTAIFNNVAWRYQPVKRYDEDGNLTLNGILDDFLDDQNGKKCGMVVKDSLLELFQTHVEYTSSDWETPGDAFKNLCDDYNVSYNNKYAVDSIAYYTLNNAFIKCHFNLEDKITFQQAIEKIAKFGAADCYSVNNELCFKVWQPFSGGVKFSLNDSDLAKPVKRKLSRKYFNNYIIGYVGDGGTPTQDVNNNYIGEVSVKNNGSHDFVVDGSDNQQIEIKDLVSAILFGETNIRRTHVNLSTNPFPPLIIDFSLPYEHKEFINLQTWFRLTNTANGWTDKLFEVYISDKDYARRLINIKAYEVAE